MDVSDMARALLLAVDPETALNLPRPHAGQQRILTEAARFNVVAAGRRWGKNVLAEILVIKALLAGKRVAWFSPTYKMLLEDWRSFVGRLAPVTRTKSEQEHRIELVTSGVLDMWSLDEPDTTRGRGDHLVVVDEAAYVKDLLYAWGRVIQPMLSDYAGAAWFISTPAGFDGFYSLYEWGQDPEKPEWCSWQRPVTENPHLKEDFAALERTAPVRDWQVEGLAKFLPGGQGAYFPEFDPAIHVCEPFEIPAGWRRSGALDYGYNPDPFCYLQFATSPDGQIFVYLEIYQQGVIVSNQARRIAEACNGDAPEDIVAGRDLWAGKGMTGKSTAETYSQEWGRLGFATRLRPAAVAPGSRVQSLRQVREYLKPYLAADGRTTTAGLQILRGHAPNLERTIQRLTFSETRPDDLADGCEDHAVDALRYGLMGRPTPRQLFQAENPPSDFEARKLLAEVQHRRRTAGKRYIGSELRDARHLDYRRYYGPSD